LTKNGPLSDKTAIRVPTLKKRSDFLRLRSGRYYASKLFILQCRSQADNIKLEKSVDYRIGYTVTTKVGNSVVRSRIKRRLREAAKIVLTNRAKSGHDYVIIAKSSVLQAEFPTIIHELSLAIDRVHGNRAKGTVRNDNHTIKNTNQDQD